MPLLRLLLLLALVRRLLSLPLTLLRRLVAPLPRLELVVARGLLLFWSARSLELELRFMLHAADSDSAFMCAACGGGAGGGSGDRPVTSIGGRGA